MGIVQKNETGRRTDIDMKKFDYMHILNGGRNGGFTVKGYDRYPRYSVLAGQTRINFVDSFDDLEDAKRAYPEATLSHELMEPTNSFNHLEGEDL